MFEKIYLKWVGGASYPSVIVFIRESLHKGILDRKKKTWTPFRQPGALPLSLSHHWSLAAISTFVRSCPLYDRLVEKGHALF